MVVGVKMRRRLCSHTGHLTSLVPVDHSQANCMLYLSESWNILLCHEKYILVHICNTSDMTNTFHIQHNTAKTEGPGNRGVRERTEASGNRGDQGTERVREQRHQGTEEPSAGNNLLMTNSSPISA